jgi:aminoglycoside phosphotransferase (APT) family kinase protein
VAEAAQDDAIASEAREAARRLAKWPTAIVHGDLTCANAVATERGAVLRRWGSAYLGCPLLDAVRLVADIVERGDAVRGIGLTRTYAERVEIVLPTEVLRGAEKLDRLARRYLRR